MTAFKRKRCDLTMSKNYRLKVRRVPLQDDVVYKRPNFPPFGELHLDLLENKTKLKKNPPKPIFVRNEPPPREKESFDFGGDKEDDDFTLEELEKAYHANDSDEVFSDLESDHEHERRQDSEKDHGEYRQEYFEQQQEEEEDEEERERTEKADLLFKFMVLKRQYPNVDIPEFTEHSEINNMRRVYEQIIRRVSLDSSVDNYKQYLVGGFMVLEWVATNWLGLDLSGFTQQQTAGMNKYERLLVELGEKNYSTTGSRFPVEIRLIFLIIFQAGLFYVQKMIFSGGGDGGPNFMNALFGGAGQQQTQQQPQRRRRAPMRGPTITPDEVESYTRQHRQGSDDDDSDEHNKTD